MCKPSWSGATLRLAWPSSKIDPYGLVAIPSGDSDRVQVGDLLLAIGNPFTIGQTVTSGTAPCTARRTAVAMQPRPSKKRAALVRSRFDRKLLDQCNCHIMLPMEMPPRSLM
jgi:hypothetical protein